MNTDYDIWTTATIAITVVLIFQGLITNCYGFFSSKKITEKNELPTRDVKLHLKRKIQHFGSGLVFLAVDMSNIMTPLQSAVVLFACAGLFLLFVTVVPREQFIAIFKDILRKEEASGQVYPATLWFLLGCGGMLILFPNYRDVYRIALLHLAAGDPAAGVIGGLYGKTKVRLVNKKTIEGCFGCFLACSMVTYVYLMFTNNQIVMEVWSTLLLFCTMSGLVGMISELIPTPMDDNFSLPIFSSTGMYILNEYWYQFNIN
jgi:dolichol kinase